MQDTAQEIVQNLQEAGHEALFAGGCVRDFLRAVLPKDFDIATSARPDQILELYPKGDTIGAHFGVILVKKAGHHFEIATFREDGDYKDGRRPESVSFSTAKKDAQRRDFTINGLFYNPVKRELIDYVGGKTDIESKIIRAIGDPEARFEEDYLRLLRAIRFATVLDFEIEDSTWSAIQAKAANICCVAAERIRQELDRIWVHENRLRGFDLLASSGLMKAIYPEIINLQGCEQPPQWHPEGDVFVHTRLMLSLLPTDASLPLVLSVLFHDIGKPATFSYDPDEDRIRFNGHDKIGAKMTEGILSRLRYSNAVIDATTAGVSNHMAFKDVQKMRAPKLKRFMARETFCDELELHRVDCESSNGNLENYHFLRNKLEEFESEPLIPPPIITGRDLIEREIPEGPRYGEILRRAQDLQLEGILTSREDALQWLETELS
jgi:poly(A) polymerase